MYSIVITDLRTSDMFHDTFACIYRGRKLKLTWDNVYISNFFPVFRGMEHSYFQHEALTSVTKAALHLLRHLLTVNELLNRRRFQFLSGIFKLLDQSLFLVKNNLSPKEISNKVNASKEIFQEALQSLHDALEKHFRWNLFHASENGRDEELKVTICFYCHF